VALLAPEQIRYEVANAITMATRRSPPRLSYEEGGRAMEEFLALGLTTSSDDPLLAAAYPLTARYGCAYYDAVYVALAQRTGLPFVTADERLYRRIRALPEAVWLGDLAIV
jgi:predicted nucleic acid-binding protein